MVPKTTPSKSVPRKDSPGFVTEISDSEPEGIPMVQDLRTETGPNEPSAGDLNMRSERLRHSTRTEQKDYSSANKGYRNGFAKLARAASFMKESEEPCSCKIAINGPERE